MKREAVQDFLNLPGIVGVALMDGRSRPYFCGVDQTLNFQQKEALAQGIQQVIDTTPANFKFFEFQFSGHQVYIYKLDHGIILLVLAASTLAYETYVETVGRLKAELQEDIANTIATFRLLAGNTTLSGQNYWKRPPDPVSTIPNKRLDVAPESSPSQPSPPPSKPPSIPSPLPSPAPTLKETLAAMNELSKFTTQYLGATVVTNYWKTTRPTIDWLNQFEVERSAQLNASNQIPPTAELTSEQQQWIQDWVDAFIQRCAKVIRDFPKSVRQKLNAHQKLLLFNETS